MLVIETEDPRLNVTFRDEACDLLDRWIHGRLSRIHQRLIKLLQTVLSSSDVSIDDYDQSRFSVHSAASEGSHFLCKTRSNPTFRATFAGGRALDPNCISITPTPQEVAIDQHTVIRVLDDHYDLRWATHSQPLAITSEGCKSPIGSGLNFSVRT